MGLDLDFLSQPKADYPATSVPAVYREWSPVGDWVPCSAEWLKAGGDCTHAPRIYNHKTRNHYHPAVMARVCHFRGFTALLQWMDRRVGDVTNGALLALTFNDMQMLDLCLSRLNEANCYDEFPDADRHYGDLYWKQVEQLKAYVKDVITDFDFSRHQLYFQAWS